MYKRILLAYDGTREGIIALREGALLAKRCGAAVFLLSVLPENEGLRQGEGVYGDVVGQQIANYKALLARGVTVLTQLGLTPVAKLVVGEPAPQIGAFAKEVKADLIVLGHRRQNLLQRWWSGGSGAYVTDYVSCSVLIGRKVISDDAFEAELQGL
jgi:nucleotide-binding universal stress UspA family protein